MESNFVISDIAKVSDPVNLNQVYSIDKVDNQKEISIRFRTSQPNSNWMPVIWKYSSIAERDADYSLILDKHVNSINESE